MQSVFGGNGSWPDDPRDSMRGKNGGGSSCQSNTGGTGKGSRRIRQWEKMNRKVQCKQKTPLPCSRLTLVLKDVGQKAIASGKALLWRPAERARRVLQPLLQPKWGAKPQSDGVGLQGSDSRSGSPWELGLTGPQNQGRPSGPLSTWGFATSWDRVPLDAGMDTPHRRITSKLVLNQANVGGLFLECLGRSQLTVGMCGLWGPSHELRRAQGARMLPRDFTLRKGSCESWQKPSWSCINSLVAQAGQVKHVPYLGFVTTLTEVPGVGQSCPCTGHLLGQEGCAEMEPASLRAWPSCSHIGDSLKSPLGSRWTQPLSPLSCSIQRLCWAAMLWPWLLPERRRERSESGRVWTGRRW